MRPLALFVLLVQVIAGQEGNAGIYFRLNQKAVDYLTGLVSEALPQLLNKLGHTKLSFDGEYGPVTLTNTLIHEVTRPNITAKFSQGKGVRGELFIPYLRVSSTARIEVFFFSSEGSLIVDVHNLTMEIEIHYTRNDTIDRNVIEAPYCSISHSQLTIIMPADSKLMSIKGDLEQQILMALKSTICETIVEALQYVDDQDVQAVVSTEQRDDLTENFEDPQAFKAGELGLSLCKAEEEEETPLSTSSTPSGPSNYSWSADLSLVYPPKFSDEDVVFGIDGGITLNGKKADDIEPAANFNSSILNKQMIAIAVLDYVPNTLISHIYDSELATFNQRFTPENLPKSLRKVTQMLCSKCYLDVSAELTDKPRLEIDENLGTRVQLHANVSVQFQGRQDLHDLIHASTEMHITLKPTIRHSRIYGDISLTSVDVNVHKMAVTGALSTPLEKLVSFIVPKVLWPQVKKRIRFALNRRGIQIPVLCGIELEHLNLYYANRAIILNSDFSFDLPMFIRKFKRYLVFKAESNPILPRYFD